MRLSEVTQKYKLNIKSSKEGYFKRLNDRTKTSLKPFWQFIKGCGSDYLGINEIDHNHHVLLDDTEKATCPHDYFRSIFLPKGSNCPPPHTSTIPLMEPVELSARGTEALLKKNIDETKANGSDGISPRILKRCGGPISLNLYLIYDKSLSTGIPYQTTGNRPCCLYS